MSGMNLEQHSDEKNSISETIVLIPLQDLSTNPIGVSFHHRLSRSDLGPTKERVILFTFFSVVSKPGNRILMLDSRRYKE